MSPLSRQRRILISTKYFSENFGGTPESILLLARVLDEICVSTDVIAPAGFFPDIQSLAGLPKLGAGGLPATAFGIASYDGVLVAGPWNFQALGIAWRARRAGVPVSYAPKGGLSWADFRRLRDIKKMPYLFSVEMLLLGMARNIVFSSPAERDNCVVPGFLLKNKQVILPEPFRSSGRPSAMPEAHPPLVLGFLAEIRSLKGLLELVEAIALLVARPGYEALRLRIAGSPRPGSEKYLARIRTLSDQLGISDRLEWLGGVRGDANRNAFYESLDIFICPSKSESFGFTPLEALWHGIPVVMGSNIGVRSHIPSDAAVVVFGKVNAQEIAEALDDAVSKYESLRIKAAAWRGRALPGLAGEALARRFFATLASPSANLG